MERDVIVDGEAMATIEGGRPVDIRAEEEAFSTFQKALSEAQRAGTIRTMRRAVEAYDRYAELAGVTT